MISLRRFVLTFVGAAITVGLPVILIGQQFPPNSYQEMRWRSIGPLRGGRTRAVAGVPSEPNVFYIGAVNGGVWKTTDYGRTWEPIFDEEDTGSIGAIAVSEVDPNIVFVTSGEGLHRPDLSTGDGIYKSTDAGRTWTHLGLRDGQQIPSIALDPHDPNRLFVAVLGHPYGPNSDRGIYRSTDGGQNFTKVLYKDEYTGGSDVELDPSNPSVVYAGLWQTQEAPWENGQFSGTTGGLFKSTDGGDTWQQLTNGLPQGIIQVSVGIARSDPNRIYASVALEHEQRVYRSDDAGANWYRVTEDQRPAGRIGGGDLAVIKPDPANPDIVYSTSVVAWRSTNGGATWTGMRGAPGGDDYQNVWINPNNSKIVLLGSDQGAIITVNGGETWSSWYNQPTAQMYHVGTDNGFPYRVCSGQQESGSACVSSRGNWGEITERDWLPVGAEEYGYATPDPLDANLVYGGKLTRFDFRTGQTAEILPNPLRSEGFRVIRTEPVIFSPVDPHILYFAANTLWETHDGGETWKQISPDLTRKTWEVPASIGKYKDMPAAQPSQRGVIYSLAPSPLDIKRIWAGTDDGLIWLTTDGGANWQNVTPPQLTAWEKVSILDASHSDPHCVYAAINTLRLDDMRPHILRTRDDGKTWSEVVNGMPDVAPVNVVREDPKRKGLLFAGTERQVFVSFDDGGNWQSLRLNMPATSVRDLLVKGDDLVAGTHGRGFWILDDVTPLRQLSEKLTEADAYLFRPEVATRVRWDVNTDTPLPPDVPAEQNPPDGAIIDYYLHSDADGPVTLEIDDSTGKPVRRYSSADALPPISPKLDIPAYWVQPPQGLSAGAGMHRFIWDLHYQPVPGIPATYPMQAVAHETAPALTSPWVMPGQYLVKLVVNGKTYTEPMTIRMDPRVRTSPAGLLQQFALSRQLYDAILRASEAIEQASTIRSQLQERKSSASGSIADQIAEMDTKLEAVAGRQGSLFEFIFRRQSGPPTLNSVRGSLFVLMNILQTADVPPTSPQVAAVSERRQAAAEVMSRWAEVKAKDLAKLNEALKQANLPGISLGGEKAATR